MSNFDQAVLAVVDGDLEKLSSLLIDEPELAKARSEAEHKATLLHYVAANGVEDELQRTPANVVAIASLLFEYGADPAATAEFYGGGPNSTPLVALVTSAHPYEMGLQIPLVDLFCQQGASPNGLANDGYPLASALAFYYPAAAKALYANGARTDNLVAASAMGDSLALIRYWQERGNPEKVAGPFPAVLHLPLTSETIAQLALAYAGLCNELSSVEFLTRQGVDVNAGPFHGQTALHYAAYSGAEEVVRFLLSLGADKGLRDRQFKGTAAGWAAVAGHEQLARLLAND